MTTARVPSPRSTSARRGPLLTLAAVVILAVVGRLWVLGTILHRLDGDEGVTAVMAQRILDGNFPAFFGSQNDQGAAEQYLQSFVLWVLPDTPFTLRLTQVALIATILVLTYLLARQVTRRQRHRGPIAHR